MLQLIFITFLWDLCNNPTNFSILSTSKVLIEMWGPKKQLQSLEDPVILEHQRNMDHARIGSIRSERYAFEKGTAFHSTSIIKELFVL